MEIESIEKIVIIYNSSNGQGGFKILLVDCAVTVSEGIWSANDPQHVQIKKINKETLNSIQETLNKSNVLNWEDTYNGGCIGDRNLKITISYNHKYEKKVNGIFGGYPDNFNELLLPFNKIIQGKLNTFNSMVLD